MLWHLGSELFWTNMVESEMSIKFFIVWGFWCGQNRFLTFRHYGGYFNEKCYGLLVNIINACWWKTTVRYYKMLMHQLPTDTLVKFCQYGKQYSFTIKIVVNMKTNVKNYFVVSHQRSFKSFMFKPCLNDANSVVVLQCWI